MLQSLIDAWSGLSPGWLVFIVSMLPIAELRAAIPLGLALGLSGWSAFLTAAAGNILIALPVLLFWPRVFLAARRLPHLGRYVDRIVQRAQQKAQGLDAKSFLGIMLFVGIPVPGTGVWTGCLVAYLLGMRIRYALAAMVLGVLLAGVLMTAVSMGLIGLVQVFSGVEYVLAALLIVLIIWWIWRKFR